MKIAYVLGELHRPSERFIEREIDALREMGAQIAVYSVEHPHRAGGRLGEVTRDLLRLVTPPAWRALLRFPLRDLAALDRTAWKEFPGGLDLAARFANEMTAWGADHVHAHFATKPAAVAAMAAAMAHRPFTFAAHARDVFTDGVALAAKVGAAEFVIVCNRAALNETAAQVPRRLRDRLFLVRHGLDLARFEFRPRAGGRPRPRVLGVGRLVEKKGFGYLINAVKQLEACSCEIAGAGPLEPRLRAQIEQLELGDRVHLHGWLAPHELADRMEAADVLVVPSLVARDGDRDGVPNVVLEAAAVGLPIVACDAGGLREFVIDGQTGRLVRPHDPSVIADAVRVVFADRVTTRRLAENARKKVENEYDLRENTQVLMNLFRRPARDTP